MCRRGLRGRSAGRGPRAGRPRGCARLPPRREQRHRQAPWRSAEMRRRAPPQRLRLLPGPALERRPASRPPQQCQGGRNPDGEADRSATVAWDGRAVRRQAAAAVCPEDRRQARSVVPTTPGPRPRCALAAGARSPATSARPPAQGAARRAPVWRRVPRHVAGRAGRRGFAAAGVPALRCPRSPSAIRRWISSCSHDRSRSPDRPPDRSSAGRGSRVVRARSRRPARASPTAERRR